VPESGGDTLWPAWYAAYDSLPAETNTQVATLQSVSSGGVDPWPCGTIAATQHYAVADYLPAYRCMNRITVVKDRRAN